VALCVRGRFGEGGQKSSSEEESTAVVRGLLGVEVTYGESTDKNEDDADAILVEPEVMTRSQGRDSRSRCSCSIWARHAWRVVTQTSAGAISFACKGITCVRS